MTELTEMEQSEKGVSLTVFVFFCFCIALIFVLAYRFGMMSVQWGELVDSDCYVRLTRVTELYETGDWYHPARMKSNTPYGDTLPWSRLFDVLLLAGAVPLSKLMGFHDALFWWGVAISPVLLALTLITLNWSTRPLLRRDGTFVVVLLFLSQTVLLSYFQSARPDHHSLMVFLFVISIGLMLRLVLKPFKSSICYSAGVIGALSVWVSVESMVPVCLSLSALTLLWVINKGDFLRKSFHFSLSLFSFSILFMFLERPLSEWKTVQFDCFSIVYACLLGLIALFCSVGSVCEHQRLFFDSCKSRIVYCLLGGGIVAFAMWLLFPRVYEGPMADVNPQIIPIWLSQISEIQPLIGNSKFMCTAVQLIGSAGVAFLFLTCLILKWGEKAKRNGWIYIAFLAAAFVSIALYQLRWAVYASTVLSIAMAELLCRILQWRKDQGNTFILALRNGFVTLVFAFGFLYTGMVIKAHVYKDKPKESSKTVSLIPLCQYLNERWAKQGQPLRIVTHLNDAGEILYRTPHEVLGSNYHRNGAGIMDSYYIMTARTDAEALEIIRKRGVDTILICPKSKEKYFNADPQGPSTFYRRLQKDPIPKGLKKMKLPDNLAENFLMFEVIYDDPQTTKPRFIASYSTR